MDLVPLLEELGVEGLREGAKEISGLCPLHERRTGRIDRHPSWSINRFTGAHFCFSCGYSGGLNSLYIDLGFPLPDDLDLVIQTESVKAGSLRLSKASGNERSLGVIEPESLSGFLHDDEAIWDEQRLGVFDSVPSRLLKLRHINASAAKTFELLWDKANRLWVLPIRDEWGELMGVQLRQKGVERNQPTAMEKSKHLFGLTVMAPLHHHVALVESPLDAARLYSIGIPAVSSFGAYVSAEQTDLLARHFRVVVIALDNDSAGDKAAAIVTPQLQRRSVFAPRFKYTGLDGDDPGDVEDDDALRDAWKRSLSCL